MHFKIPLLNPSLFLPVKKQTNPSSKYSSPQKQLHTTQVEWTDVADIKERTKKPTNIKIKIKSFRSFCAWV